MCIARTELSHRAGLVHAPEIAGLLGHDQARFVAMCRSLCGPRDDLEELLQDTYLEILRHLAGFRGEASFLTWAMAVARSQLHRQRRRQRRYAAGDEAVEFAASSFPELVGRGGRSPEDHTHDERLRVVIDEALASLSELDRKVFVLREAEGMTAPEVARALGLSVSAVKSRLHRARALLRDRLDKDIYLAA